MCRSKGLKKKLGRISGELLIVLGKGKHDKSELYVCETEMTGQYTFPITDQHLLELQGQGLTMASHFNDQCDIGWGATHNHIYTWHLQRALSLF